MLGTFATAGEIKPASLALTRQTLPLRNTEAETLWVIVYLKQGLFLDIAQEVFGINEMITVVHVTVVLHHKAITTSLTHRADSRLDVAILGERGVKHLDIILSHIADDPFIEYVIQELSVTLGAHTPWRESGTLCLWGDYHRPPVVWPVHHMFHSRKELHVMAADGLEE